MDAEKKPGNPMENRLEELERRVSRLEAALDLVRGEREKAQARKKEIQRRMLLENLPLTALIVALAVLAAQWVWHLLGF